MIAQRILALTLLSSVLIACGGGGSGGDGAAGGPSAPPGPSAADLSNAQNARMHMTLSGVDLIVTWVDTFSDELNYVIERNSGSGYVWVDTVPAVDGGNVRWHGHLTQSGSYRVSARLEGNVTVPLPVAPNETEVRVEQPQSIRNIQLSSAEQFISGAVEVSVPDAGPALSVSYFLDGTRVAKITSGGSFATTLQAQHLVAGSYDLRAEIEKSAGLTEIIHHPLNVSTQNAAAVHLRVAPALSIANSLELTARASSSAGIVSVQLFANGNPLRTLGSPDRAGQWKYALDPSTLQAGANTFRAVATDADGRIATMDAEYTVDPDAPSLTVEGLFDGMIVPADGFDVRGTFAAASGEAILTLSIAGRTLLRTRTSPFSTQFSLTDPPGGHLISAQVEDSAGRVTQLHYLVTAATTTRPYELITPDAAQLLAADAGALLYQTKSGAVLLRAADGSETELQVPSGLSFSKWWLTQGRVLAQERINYHLHLFTAAGQTIDLSEQMSSVPDWWNSPKIDGPWISWATMEGYGPFVVYNLESGTGEYVVPANAMYAHRSHEFLSGDRRLLFMAGFDDSLGLYSHDLSMNTTVQLMPGNYWQLESDGTRLAFGDGETLHVAALADLGAPMQVTTNLYDFAIEDGLLLWSTWDFALRVDDGTSTTLLAERSSSVSDYTIEDGNIIFDEGYRMYSWSRSAGKQLLVDYYPMQMMQTQGTAYLLTGQGGGSGALYRVTLP